MLITDHYHPPFSPICVRNQMKLFQQLLVAPAALGLMAPMAANAADLDIKGVSDYSASSEQVTSISQFQDVYPTDWAYQALSNLIERYGCVAGYPSGSYLGNRAMTRFEAAALLNACLDRITEVTDELRRLLNEFEQELAILKAVLMAKPALVNWKPLSSPPPPSLLVRLPLLSVQIALLAHLTT